jgi:DNA-directed RNA polymerase subunit beta'
MSAYENKVITLHTPVKIRIDGTLIDTTYGRYLFNEIIPAELGYVNQTVGKSGAKKILSRAFEILGGEATAFLADDIKAIGFKYATLSGVTISKDDMIIPESKKNLVKDGEEKIREIQKAYWNGYMTE